MLKSFYFKNYKAFNEKTTIDIADINVLLGKNSIGKSSVLEVLLLILQTLESDTINSENVPLVLNGKRLKLGNKGEFVYSHKNTNPTQFEFGFIFDGKKLHGLLIVLYKRFTRVVRANMDRPLLEMINRVEYFAKKFEEISNIQKIDIVNIKMIKRVLKAFITENEGKISDKRTHRSHVNFIKDILKFSETIEFFLNIVPNDQSGIDDNVEVNISFTKNRKNFFINKYSLSFGGKDFFEILNRNSQNIFKKNGIFDDLELNFNKIFPKVIENDENIYSLRSFLSNEELLNNIFLLIENEFNDVFNKKKIHHIGPLRANPKRHYLLDEIYDFSSNVGECTVQELSNKRVEDFVNKWFKEFGFEINSKSKTDSVLKSLKVKQNGGVRDIVDVGFGISQILPIIVQTMIVPVGSIVLIEQPEIHLHPSMQSKLADLFVEIINTRKINLIIETHSEHFLNRLKLRLIQTKNQSEDIKISEYITSDKLNIYFFNENNHTKGTDISKIKIHDYGKIDFPKGFKEDEIKDTFLYMKELLKSNFN